MPAGTHDAAYTQKQKINDESNASYHQRSAARYLACLLLLSFLLQKHTVRSRRHQMRLCATICTCSAARYPYTPTAH
jgi:hypothetical protein